MQTRVGFIGLGKIGSPMCRRIISAGHSVRVYDINPEHLRVITEIGGIPSSSSKDVTEHSEFIFLSLPDSKVVEEVVFGRGGVIERASKGKILIDTSSSQPKSTKEIALELKKLEMDMVDAPVARGVSNAETGTLSMMVGGSIQAIERCKAILQCLATDIFYMGEIGNGHKMKMLNNFVSSTCYLITTEAITLGAKAGLDPKQINTVLNASSGRSYATEKRFPDQVFSGKFSSGFSIQLMHKDVVMALDMAQELNVPTPVGAATAQVYTQAMAEGLGTKDNIYLAERSAKNAKVTFI